ncbi:hypothetical protein QJS10_CPA10g00309 [Acorus calamus]|uniref:DUF569 domain-containing protein n=1 Tax=Acorus calamus TaxID=4465 RepID=A0AAV9DYA6_ACOCL|nr:hypothetical protein QJS10_CPA10g00309 [Acorus calamus]
MELFHKAKAVRLRSHHDKYLLAEDDEESVCQDRNGSSRNARWTVEFVQEGGGNVFRLRSCYGRYLTASNVPFLLGMTGRKVLQTVPNRLDSSVEWEPIREGFLVKLKTRYDHFLRANGGIPPWRNSVTHDIPHRTATQDWVLWDVDIVEFQMPSPSSLNKPSSGSVPSSSASPKLSKLESSNSFSGGSPPKNDGRTIYYLVANEVGNVDDAFEESSILFKGNGVSELMRRLEEETGIHDIIVCSRSPLNGKLYPLHLQLPPNNTTMHVVVVHSSAKVAKGFKYPEIPS